MPTDITFETAVRAARAGVSYLDYNPKIKTFEYTSIMLDGLTQYTKALRQIILFSSKDLGDQLVINITTLLDKPQLNIEELYKAQEMGAITKTQFLLLVRLKQFQHIIAEIELLKSKGITNYKTIMESINLIDRLDSSIATSIEGISKVDPASYEAFKILNHYALSGLTEQGYGLADKIIKIDHIIEEIVKSIVFKLIDYRQEESKFSDFTQITLAYGEKIIKGILDPKTESSDAFTPEEKILIKHARSLLQKTKRLLPEDIAGFFKEIWFKFRLNFNFDIENQHKLRVYIARLIATEDRTGLKVSAELFKPYLAICFPGNTAESKKQQADAYLKIADFITTERVISLTIPQELEKKHTDLEKKISYISDLIAQHKQTASIVAHPALLDRLSTASSRLLESSSRIETSIKDIYAETEKKQQIKKALELFKEVLSHVLSDYDPKLRNIIIESLAILEKYIVDICESDQAVRQRAIANLIADLTTTAANHSDNTIVHLCKDCIITFLQDLGETTCQKEQLSLLKKCLGQIIYKLTASHTVHAVSSFTSRFTTQISDAFKVLTEDEPAQPETSDKHQKLAEPLQPETQHTSDQLELLDSLLESQQKELLRFIRDMTFHAKSLLNVSIDLKSTIITGDARQTFAELTTPVFEPIPLPYYIADQLKLVHDLGSMRDKIAQLIRKTEVTPNRITKEMDNAHRELEETYRRLDENSKKLYQSIVDTTLEQCEEAFTEAYDYELNKGKLIASENDYGAYVKHMSRVDFDERQERSKKYKELFSVIQSDKEISHKLEDLLNKIKALKIDKSSSFDSKTSIKLTAVTRKIKKILKFTRNPNDSSSYEKTEEERSFEIIKPNWVIACTAHVTRALFWAFKILSIILKFIQIIFITVFSPIIGVKLLVSNTVANIRAKRPGNLALKMRIDSDIRAIINNLHLTQELKDHFIKQAKSLLASIGREDLASLEKKYNKFSINLAESLVVGPSMDESSSASTTSNEPEHPVTPELLVSSPPVKSSSPAEEELPTDPLEFAETVKTKMIECYQKQFALYLAQINPVLENIKEYKSELAKVKVTDSSDRLYLEKNSELLKL
ncbi:MAG: hypothetical protein KBD64_07565, partial [Gammaproteobacteria bacterium]|nr:hypothetical protein [Gammaproteobacteria bacterium]